MQGPCCMCSWCTHACEQRKIFLRCSCKQAPFHCWAKKCPNWFSCKNRIIPFHLIKCPLHRVQAPLHFSPQLSLPQHVMSFGLEYSKKQKKKNPRLLGATCSALVNSSKNSSFPKETSNRVNTNICRCSLLLLICVLRTTRDWRSQRRGWITAWSTGQSNCSLEIFETEGRLG